MGVPVGVVCGRYVTPEQPLDSKSDDYEGGLPVDAPESVCTEVSRFKIAISSGLPQAVSTRQIVFLNGRFLGDCLERGVLRFDPPKPLEYEEDDDLFRTTIEKDDMSFEEVLFDESIDKYGKPKLGKTTGRYSNRIL